MAYIGDDFYSRVILFLSPQPAFIIIIFLNEAHDDRWKRTERRVESWREPRKCAVETTHRWIHFNPLNIPKKTHDAAQRTEHKREPKREKLKEKWKVFVGHFSLLRPLVTISCVKKVFWAISWCRHASLSLCTLSNSQKYAHLNLNRRQKKDSNELGPPATAAGLGSLKTPIYTQAFTEHFSPLFVVKCEICCNKKWEFNGRKIYSYLVFMLAPSTALIPLVLSLFTALGAPLLLLDILKISLTAIKCREHLLIYMKISGTGSP